jgi:hypothetical protein
MTNFFATTGCATVAIAELSVGILLCLARKFLAREEMAQFHFQEEFLQPFVDIMERQTALKVQDLIVDCIHQILLNQGTVLQSGWAVVFLILNRTFSHEALTAKGYSILLTIVSDHLLYVKPYFDHLITVMSSFITNDHTGTIACQLVSALSRVARTLSSSDSENWISLFQTLSRCVMHPSKEVRDSAEETFVSIVLSNGCAASAFSHEVWVQVLSKTLFTFFPSQNESDWRVVPLLKDLFRLIFEPYISIVSPYTGSILSLIRHCCNFRGVQTEAIGCLLSFVKAGPEIFESDESLNLLINCLKDIVSNLADSVFFVEVLANLLAIFAADDERAGRFVEVIGMLANESAHSTSVTTLCRARGEYFAWIVVHGREDEAAEHLRESLASELANPDVDREELTVKCLTILKSLSDDAFAKVANHSLDLLCELIEAKSNRIRVALAPIVRRKLNIV